MQLATDAFEVRQTKLGHCCPALGSRDLIALEPHVKLFARTSLPLSAEVLAHTARQHIAALGYSTGDMSHAEGFELDRGYLDEIRATCPTAVQWRQRLAPARPSLLANSGRSGGGGGNRVNMK